jgi:hypothetical protein
MFLTRPAQRVRADRRRHYRPRLLQLEGRVLPSFVAALSFDAGGGGGFQR